MKVKAPIKRRFGIYRIKNIELYQKLEIISTVMRNGRVIFYAYLSEIYNQRIASRIFSTFSRGNATNAKWMKLARND